MSLMDAEPNVSSRIKLLYKEEGIEHVIKEVETKDFFKDAGLQFTKNTLLRRTGAVIITAGILFTIATRIWVNSVENHTMTSKDIQNMDIHDIEVYLDEGNDYNLLNKIRSFASQIPACAEMKQ